MLVKSWINKYGDGYVQVTHANEQIRITRYASNPQKNVMRAMDADIASLRNLTGAIVHTHRDICDRTHTNFASPCNSNLHPDVIKRREEIAARSNS